MLRFQCFPGQGHGPLTELRGAYLIGNDGVPLRGDLRLADGEIRCQPRSPEPAALSLLWPVEDFGTVQLETTRLPDRAKPYVLNLELARHRLMRISLKREEWGLFDYHGMGEISRQIEQARVLFIEAMQAVDDPRAAARLADQSLQLSLQAGERMCLFHASVFLERRQQSGDFTRPFLGTAIAPTCPPSALTPQVRETFDFVRIPFVWRGIQPKESDTSFEHIDTWVKACGDAKLSVRGGPLLNFGVQSVPDWMYIWENDFDTILDYARAHVGRCVQRYAKQVDGWVVASGLHADNVFSFNFEQIMEVTREAAGTVRQFAPRAQIVLDLTQPWGEYFARNQCSIPPLLYADMAVQSGINFDAFGLQFILGLGTDGYHFRDALQISSLIDKLANLGKPLHVTAVAIPSTGEAQDHPVAGGGQWCAPWSDQAQAKWLSGFCEVALSKPYVESVCLHTLTDTCSSAIPSAGALREDFSPKPAFDSLTELHQRLQAAPAK